MGNRPAITILAIVLLSSTLLSATVVATTLGAKVGLTSSSMRMGAGQYGQSEWHSGFIGGIYKNFTLSESFTLQPAILFARRGGDYHDVSSMLWGGLTVVDELRIRRSYLEVPLLFRYRFMADHTVSPIVVAGPSWGYVVASETWEDGGLYPDQAGNSDYAFVVGAGCDMKLGKHQIEFEVTYRRAASGLSGRLLGGYFRADGVNAMVGIDF